MFNEAGPSRLPLRPPLNGPGIPGRPSVPRRESDYDGGVRERDRDERNDFRSAEVCVMRLFAACVMVIQVSFRHNELCMPR